MMAELVEAMLSGLVRGLLVVVRMGVLPVLACQSCLDARERGGPTGPGPGLAQSGQPAGSLTGSR